MQNDATPKKKSILPIIIAVGGIVIVAAAVILFLVLSGGNNIIGPWHNSALKQQIRFIDDNSVVINTQYGVSEGSYVFDPKSGKGTITTDGKSLGFTLEGDTLKLADGEFIRGEIDIQVFAEATPTATPPDLPTPTMTPAITSMASQTPAGPSPSAKPTVTSSPSASATLEIIKPSLTVIIKPSLTLPQPLTPSPSSTKIIINPSVLPTVKIVVGTWVRQNVPSEKLKFNDDGTVSHTIQGVTAGGEYEFNKFTGEGSMEISGRENSFTVSGNQLTLDDGKIFIRG